MTTKAGERPWRDALLDQTSNGWGVPRTAIEAVEAEAVRDALTDLRAVVEGMGADHPESRNRLYLSGFADAIAAVLDAIDKRMPGGANPCEGRDPATGEPCSQDAMCDACHEARRRGAS